MKKLLSFALMASNLLSIAQTYSTSIKSIDWKITKITNNGTDYYSPSPFSYGSGKLNFEERNNLAYVDSKFYNVTSAEVTFGDNNANYFTIKNPTSTLSVYYGDNEVPVQQFDGLVGGFYHNQNLTNKYTFDYQETTDGKSLIVTNSAGNKIYYSNKTLAVSSVTKQNFSLSPNPTSDVLHLKNIGSNSDIKITDAQGKLVLKANNQQMKDYQLSVKDLPKGIYFISVNNETSKFIKN